MSKLTCSRCQKPITGDHYIAGVWGEPVCCKCADHHHMTAEDRLAQVADELEQAIALTREEAEEE